MCLHSRREPPRILAREWMMRALFSEVQQLTVPADPEGCQQEQARVAANISQAIFDTACPGKATQTQCPRVLITVAFLGFLSKKPHCCETLPLLLSRQGDRQMCLLLCHPSDSSTDTALVIPKCSSQH